MIARHLATIGLCLIFMIWQRGKSMSWHCCAGSVLLLTDRQIRLSDGRGVDVGWNSLDISVNLTTRLSGGEEKGVNHSDVAKVYVTNVGWNSPNMSVNLTTCRTEWSMYMNEHLLGNPRRVSSLYTANPTYMFMDVETCGENNWPRYALPTRNGNYDTADHRVGKADPLCVRGECSKVFAFVRSLPGRAVWHPQTQLVLFDGHGFTPIRCFKRSDTRVVVAGMNFEVSTYRPGVDIAMPSQAVKPTAFPQGPPDFLKTCIPRKLLLSFSGSLRSHPFRRQLQRLHNGLDIIVAEAKEVRRLGFNYSDLMSISEFSAAPRGTDPQTYRFPEILSAGAIPVVYADGFILPFSEILDYSEIAVIIPQRQVNQTRELLEAIPLRRRCEMRRNALQAYRQHFADLGKVFDTILRILDARAQYTPMG